MKKRIQSFKYAYKGIRNLVSSEINFQIHVTAAVLVLFAGFYLELVAGEWIAVLLCFALVLSAEAFNSAIEELVDFVSPGHHEKAGKIKDIAAGAVLITAMLAAVIGCVVFLPKIIARLN